VSVSALTAVGASGPLPCVVTFDAIGGTEYRVAVDGISEGGPPKMNNFQLHLSLRMPKQGGGERGSGALPDMSPPNTTIGRTKLRAARRSASFAFSSTEAGSTFRCKLDKGAFAACKSPRTYKNLKPGKHNFKVAAVDAAGNVDPSPAVSRFQVTKPKARKRGKG
jgi:hypothetical protein